TIFESNMLTIFVALGLISWPRDARMMRSQVLTIKNLDYITAAKAHGATNREIILRHILPNSLATLIMIATLGVASGILAESTLSYLGIGVKISAPSWRTLVDVGTTYIMNVWWYAIFPGMEIMLTVLGFNFIVD